MTLPSSRYLRVRRGVPIGRHAYNPGISRRTRHGWFDRRRRRPRVRAGECRRRVPRLAERGRKRHPGAGRPQRARPVTHPRRAAPRRARGHSPRRGRPLRFADTGYGDRSRAPLDRRRPHGRRRVRLGVVQHRRPVDYPPRRANDCSNPASDDHVSRSDDDHSGGPDDDAGSDEHDAGFPDNDSGTPDDHSSTPDDDSSTANDYSATANQRRR
jgi:hypothetical protein